MPPTVAFLPSPLISSSRFFSPLMAAIGERSVAAVCTSLADDHTVSAVDGLHRRMWPGRPYVLVAYSGAGALVPGVLAGMHWPPCGVIFVDATLPHPGRARIDEFRETLPPGAFASFEQHLRAGGTWPAWTDSDLAPLIPDGVVRQRLLSLVTPQLASFFERALPPDGLPPDLPATYLRLSPAYDAALASARSRGWATRTLDLTHFAPYTHPAEVAHELTFLVRNLGRVQAQD